MSALCANTPALPEPQEILQQQRPESWPDWMDVEMDSSILADETLQNRFTTSLAKAPSLMLEVSEDALFGDGGLYVQSHVEKRNEFPVKATYFHPEKEGFSMRCGIRVQGSGSVTQSPKRNFRLRFSKKYGEGSLSYALFSERVESFENLLIRNPTHDSWTVKWSQWRKNPRYVNDRWALETARLLGNLSPRQQWVHVYLNDLYWGIYALSERPDEHFAASHLRMRTQDLDIFNAAEIRHGSEEQRLKSERFLTQEFTNTPEAFEKLEEFLDLNAFMDHLICQIYQGKSDWPKRNYFLVGQRSSSSRFTFGAWDSEVGFYEKPRGLGQEKQSALYYAPLTSSGFMSDQSGPGFWYQHLRSSEEFRLMLSPKSWLFQRFFSLRPIALKQHFREEGIWPELEPPTFQTRQGHQGGRKFYLKNPNPRGIIVFTQDGSDPREQWTGKPRGKAFREAIEAPSGKIIKARILSRKKWSPLMFYQQP